jgi:hypothetical protein
MALTDNLISYWKMDESSGNALDSHGSNDLTDNNTVTSAAGIISNARSFASASSEYFSRADNADLSTGDIDFTVQAWVYLADKSGSQYVGIGKWNSPNLEYILIYDIASDRFLFVISDNGISGTASVVANTFGSPSTATWYLVHCWHDAANNEIGIAVNAGTADTTSHSTGVRDGSQAFEIGRNNDGGAGYYHNGRIDEVGFWKRVLSSSERAELYGGGAGLAYPFTSGGVKRRLALLGVG